MNFKEFNTYYFFIFIMNFIFKKSFKYFSQIKNDFNNLSLESLFSKNSPVLSYFGLYENLRSEV